jgi:hypothetical protein
VCQPPPCSLASVDCDIILFTDGGCVYTLMQADNARLLVVPTEIMGFRDLRVSRCIPMAALWCMDDIPSPRPLNMSPLLLPCNTQHHTHAIERRPFCAGPCCHPIMIRVSCAVCVRGDGHTLPLSSFIPLAECYPLDSNSSLSPPSSPPSPPRQVVAHSTLKIIPPAPTPPFLPRQVVAPRL